MRGRMPVSGRDHQFGVSGNVGELGGIRLRRRQRPADEIGDALGEPARCVGGGLGTRRVMEEFVAQHDSQARIAHGIGAGRERDARFLPRLDVHPIQVVVQSIFY